MTDLSSLSRTNDSYSHASLRSVGVIGPSNRALEAILVVTVAVDVWDIDLCHR
jgi:hypothetical protein